MSVTQIWNLGMGKEWKQLSQFPSPKAVAQGLQMPPAILGRDSLQTESSLFEGLCALRSQTT